MKYQLSINQRAIIESGLDIDLIDAAIIDCMAGMFARTSLKKMIDSGKCYTWIAMSTVEKELPIIRLKKRAVVSRITALANIGVIERHQDNQSNAMSFFCAGANWDRLFVKQQDAQSLRSTTTECSSMHSPMQQDAQPPMQQDAHYPNTINQVTINQKESTNFSSLAAPIENEKISLQEKPEQQQIEKPSEPKEKSCAKIEKVAMPFASENFSELWQEWKVYKRLEHRFSYKTEQSETRALEQLVKLSKGKESAAVSILCNSMANGWKGFFVDKESATAKHKGIAPVSQSSPEESAEKFKKAGWTVKLA